MTEREIINAILQTMEERGISRKDLARRTGFSNSTLYTWDEEKRSPNIRSLLMVADVLNMELIMRKRCAK